MNTSRINRVPNGGRTTGRGGVSETSNNCSTQVVVGAGSETGTILKHDSVNEGENFTGVGFGGGETAHFGGGIGGGSGAAPDRAVIFDVAGVPCCNILPTGERGKFLGPGVNTDRGDGGRARFCYFCDDTPLLITLYLTSLQRC